MLQRSRPVNRHDSRWAHAAQPHAWRLPERHNGDEELQNAAGWPVRKYNSAVSYDMIRYIITSLTVVSRSRRVPPLTPGCVSQTSVCYGPKAPDRCWRYYCIRSLQRLTDLTIDIVDPILKHTSDPGFAPSNDLAEPDLPANEPQQPEPKAEFIYIIVPLMLLFSSAIMATAWLGHLRFKEDLTFWMATLFAWLLVLPEYALNITALRLGYRKFTGGQMGAFRLCTGVACIAFVSHYLLGEQLTTLKLLGFGIMAFSMILISSSESKSVEQ